MLCQYVVMREYAAKDHPIRASLYVKPCDSSIIDNIDGEKPMRNNIHPYYHIGRLSSAQHARGLGQVQDSELSMMEVHYDMSSPSAVSGIAWDLRIWRAACCFLAATTIPLLDVYCRPQLLAELFLPR